MSLDPALTPRIPVNMEALRELLFGNGQTGANPFDAYDARIAEGRKEVVEHATKVNELDSLTLELVRLRNAALQGCNACMTIRSKPAQREGLSESMVDQVHDFEKSQLFDERTRVALRLVDAFIIDFGHVPADLAETARRYFSRKELLDIGLKAFAMSTNKMRIALGLDFPERQPELVRQYEYPTAPGREMSGAGVIGT